MNHATIPAGNRPPGRWMRMVYRAPLVFYRLGGPGCERWLGLRWILVVTRGRVTGREHAVLLDLIGEDADRGRYFVQAAYGRRADWVRNIEATGRLEAEVCAERFAARMEVVEDREARSVMLAYVERHRFYSPAIARVLGYRGSRQEPRAVADWLVDRFGMLVFVRQPDEPDAA